MPLIKKQEKKIIRMMTFRMEEELADQVSAYAKYLDSSRDHVVNEALRYIMDRDKEFQAILPLRGKVLNSWETERDRLFANNEIHDIAVAIGVDPHGPNDTPDLSGLRYGKICILSDADVDGSHIQVLLLTLFFKHFPALFRNGHVCVARPPLYRVDVPARGGLALAHQLGDQLLGAAEIELAQLDRQ